LVYCKKCGKKNEDESEYCSKCGTSLTDKKIYTEKEFDKRCEEECAGGKHGAPIFWGILVILIGLWIIFEFVLKNIEGLPTEFSWIYDFEFFWVFALLIAIAIIITGFRIITRR
jgi:uncharacterized membrane protein YvbJ